MGREREPYRQHFCSDAIVIRRAIATCHVVLLVTLLSACALPREDAPPPGVAEQYKVLGIANARFWVDRHSEALLEELQQQARRAQAAQPGAAPAGEDLLAISGGSDNGAFGAGLLAGWSARGTRPEFRAVTGISAGALTAPFAFLGASEDQHLREVFTKVTPGEIFIFRQMLRALLFYDAVADTGPLSSMIYRYVNDDMMAAIAREYAKGRLLLIGTTNLDLQRPVVWNIGAIAASGHPKALDLFRRILLASASPPGAFPPVFIDVEVDGRRFQEMHVDGGAVAQLFLYPAWLHLGDWSRANGVSRERTAWLIRNSRADPEPDSTQRQLLSIGRRAVSTLVHFGGLNDLVRIYLTTRRDGVHFRLAFIGNEFNAPRAEFFDQSYMRALFDHGFDQARAGYPWRTEPPGFSAADVTDAVRAPETAR